MRAPCSPVSPHRALIAFGSNVGDRAAHLTEALRQLSERLDLVSVSGFYETAPMYVEDQPLFLNGAVLVETDLDASALLRFLKETEARIGRLPRERNGPREIDLDIIDIEGGAGPAERLTVPHPRAHERRFVLEPLNEIAPEWVLQGNGAVRDLFARPDVQLQEVRRTADAPVLIQRDRRTR